MKKTIRIVLALTVGVAAFVPVGILIACFTWPFSFMALLLLCRFWIVDYRVEFEDNRGVFVILLVAPILLQVFWWAEFIQPPAPSISIEW